MLQKKLYELLINIKQVKNVYKKSSPIPLFLKINNKALIAMFKFRWFWNFITFFAANALQSANFVLQYLFKFNLAMYSLQHNADYVASKPMTKTFSVMLFRILGVSIYFFDWILYNTLTLCYNICRFMNFCVCFLRHNSNQIDI